MAKQRNRTYSTYEEYWQVVEKVSFKRIALLCEIKTGR